MVNPLYHLRDLPQLLKLGVLGLNATGTAPKDALVLPADPVPLESEVYESVVRLLELAGCQVYRLSQVRASRQTAGLPDLWVFGPGKRCAWIEVKRPGGRLRAEQRVFRERCQERKVEHLVGGLPEVERLLVQWNLAEALPTGGIVLTPRGAR